MSYFIFADDRQLCISVSPHEQSPFQSLRECIHDISVWMGKNFLQPTANEKVSYCFWSQKKNIRGNLTKLDETKNCRKCCCLQSPDQHQIISHQFLSHSTCLK
ncbi:hypothetical protein ATANTOWER_025278 [Ataeniobius toweri]|uniref:Reverse transcriptase n=1 Tax=Ataeniobius toweri TaxID=208326 RepID=A0ABU7BA75_9TELE|nr:hypothetical protein [Ataeniobius toweri]